MTFCFFSAQYLPTPGGVERYTWNLARRCVAAGHRALIVTSALPGQPSRERDSDGLEIFRLPALPVMGGRFPVLRPFAPAADLWAQKIDFAVIQTRMYTQSIWAARQCKRRGIPALVIDHSTGYMMRGGLGGLLGRWYEHLACGLIRRCGFPFYGVSRDVCRWLETFGIQAAGTLPNAVDPAELAVLAREEPRTDWRQRLQVPPGGHLILFVGRLIPEKGALCLAKAMERLPGCVLAVAGTGPEEEALRALGGPVRVLGALPHRQIVQLLDQADCYCLPTRYAEGFPTTLLEAAACRCPILCTHTAGTGELLPDDSYAAFLEDTDPHTLADALGTLLSAPESARDRAERAFCNLSAHFTWQAVFATMMKTAQSAQTRREKEPRCPNYSS
ncbi:MAG: glycosyltransferase family 4 protein [Clostridiaceae bacterium]|nr:glycosyltransferase family 4 protein [Clostridiaceae bacterium]